MSCGKIMECHCSQAIKVEVCGHGAEADIYVMGCGEMWVGGEAICFSDSSSDAFVYCNLSLLVVFFCFFDLKFECFLPFLLCFLCILLLCSLASFFFLVSVDFCLLWFFHCVELGTW